MDVLCELDDPNLALARFPREPNRDVFEAEPKARGVPSLAGIKFVPSIGRRLGLANDRNDHAPCGDTYQQPAAFGIDLLSLPRSAIDEDLFQRQSVVLVQNWHETPLFRKGRGR